MLSSRFFGTSLGKLLREYSHGIEDLEITSVSFVSDNSDGPDRIIAAGWNAKVFVWDDDDGETIEDHETLKGHHEDVLHIAGDG